MLQLTTRSGSTATDTDWDTFLKLSPKGHFEQSSGWAKAKSTEGWQCFRIELLGGERIVGGCQVLFRRRGLFRIGYISKGPVLNASSSEAIDYVIQCVKSQAIHHKISALLVNPPERAREITDAMNRNGFLPNRLQDLIKATLLVNLRQDQAHILRGMDAETRRKIRYSERHGVKVREGSVSDLPYFFELMLATCRRQGNVKPNPASLRALEVLWHNFHPTGNLRLTLAEVAERPVASLLCISFGDRVTLWKKGWNSEYGNLYPNDYLYHESLEWSWRQRYGVYDFGGLSLDMANALRNNNPLSEHQKSARDLFNLRFGGYPVLLPEARVWIPNALMRRGYRLFVKIASLRQEFK